MKNMYLKRPGTEKQRKFKKKIPQSLKLQTTWPLENSQRTIQKNDTMK